MYRTGRYNVGVYEDNSFSIGRTPLVRLNRVTDGAKATILAKIEGRNPAYSVKCRIGASMVWDAEKRGILKPGKELMEPTSGNTGIALAFVAAARGYPITLTMPETMSVERRKVLKALGAKLMLTEARWAWPAPSSRRKRWWRPTRPLRAAAAVQESGESRDPRSKPRDPRSGTTPRARSTCWSPGIGTGGTITGVSRYIKQDKRKQIFSVAVEPVASPVITQTLNRQPLRPGPHKIQGIGAGFIPDTLDLAMVDRVELVTNEESIEMARRLSKEEGILSGISCGAAVAAAVRIAQEDNSRARQSSSFCPIPASDI